MAQSHLEYHVLLDMQRIQQKLTRLEQLQQLKNWQNIRLMFEAQNGFKQDFVILDQYTFPFLLENEIKNLIEDSIEQCNRDIESLKFTLKNL
jgi:hypothetical protein